MTAPTLFGLEPRDLEKIASIFRGHPHVESVLFFGSRALGTFGPGSDIDLAVVGSHLTRADLVDFRQRLDALHLPWFVDLLHLDRLADPEVREHIERVGRKLW